MKIGMFGYPGDQLDRVIATCDALKRAGATRLVCLGGLVWSGRKGEAETEAPATVLRWLRANEIVMLGNDMDRQVAGWRLQALENTTGYIKPRIRRFLATITREEAMWMYHLPSEQPFGNVLCCADNLTVDALFPVPLSRFNARKLFDAMDQRAAFFPSALGPTLVVRKQEDGVIEGSTFDGMQEFIDAPRFAAVIGGVNGFPPLNIDYGWSAVVDGDATEVSLICLNAQTYKSEPEHGNVLVHRAEMKFQ